MFLFVTRYLGFLKRIPGLAMLFDSWLKMISVLTNPNVLDYIDDIGAEVLKWNNTTQIFHKYGGLQFNYNGKELGHIHSNGLLDMLLSRNIKQQLLTEGYVEEHHFLKNTGWISFYINTKNDKEYAIKLLKMGYDKHAHTDITHPRR